MITGNIQITTLEPDDGKWLTNGETFSKKVYLGKNDSPDNWQEITEEEKERFEKEIKEKSQNESLLN